MIGAGFLFSNSAAAKETLPTLPQNISIISTIWDTTPNELVRPAERPTVLIAEKVSINIFDKEAGSTAAIIKVPVNAKDILIVLTSRALCKNSSLMLLLKAEILSLPLTFDATKANIIKSEVVFIPPAVEPELPPINIKIMVKSLDASEKEAISTVLKPAVLGVTALKKLFKSFDEKDISLNNLLFSKIKNKSVPRHSKTAETVNTILL